ncbi:unnamed protein product [Somion occarium]|uniref:Uncharacterized protein n=1 Tax=Somion occarium TaxID=3059160 RepID=A0ABP1CWB6_9APHY
MDHICQIFGAWARLFLETAQTGNTDCIKEFRGFAHLYSSLLSVYHCLDLHWVLHSFNFASLPAIHMNSLHNRFRSSNLAPRQTILVAPQSSRMPSDWHGPSTQQMERPIESFPSIPQVMTRTQASSALQPIADATTEPERSEFRQIYITTGGSPLRQTSDVPSVISSTVAGTSGDIMANARSPSSVKTSLSSESAPQNINRLGGDVLGSSSNANDDAASEVPTEPNSPQIPERQNTEVGPESSQPPQSLPAMKNSSLLHMQARQSIHDDDEMDSDDDDGIPIVRPTRGLWRSRPLIVESRLYPNRNHPRAQTKREHRYINPTVESLTPDERVQFDRMYQRYRKRRAPDGSGPRQSYSDFSRKTIARIRSTPPRPTASRRSQWLTENPFEYLAQRQRTRAQSMDVDTILPSATNSNNDCDDAMDGSFSSFDEDVPMDDAEKDDGDAEMEDASAKPVPAGKVFPFSVNSTITPPSQAQDQSAGKPSKGDTLDETSLSNKSVSEVKAAEEVKAVEGCKAAEGDKAVSSAASRSIPISTSAASDPPKTETRDSNGLSSAATSGCSRDDPNAALNTTTPQGEPRKPKAADESSPAITMSSDSLATRTVSTTPTGITETSSMGGTRTLRVLHEPDDAGLSGIPPPSRNNEDNLQGELLTKQLNEWEQETRTAQARRKAKGKCKAIDEEPAQKGRVFALQQQNGTSPPSTSMVVPPVASPGSAATTNGPARPPATPKNWTLADRLAWDPNLLRRQQVLQRLEQQFGLKSLLSITDDCSVPGTSKAGEGSLSAVTASQVTADVVARNAMRVVPSTTAHTATTAGPDGRTGYSNTTQTSPSAPLPSASRSYLEDMKEINPYVPVIEVADRDNDKQSPSTSSPFAERRASNVVNAAESTDVTPGHSVNSVAPSEPFGTHGTVPTIVVTPADDKSEQLGYSETPGLRLPFSLPPALNVPPTLNVPAARFFLTPSPLRGDIDNQIRSSSRMAVRPDQTGRNSPGLSTRNHISVLGNDNMDRSAELPPTPTAPPTSIFTHPPALSTSLASSSSVSATLPPSEEPGDNSIDTSATANSSLSSTNTTDGHMGPLFSGFWNSRPSSNRYRASNENVLMRPPPLDLLNPSSFDDPWQHFRISFMSELRDAQREEFEERQARGRASYSSSDGVSRLMNHPTRKKTKTNSKAATRVNNRTAYLDSPRETHTFVQQQVECASLSQGPANEVRVATPYNFAPGRLWPLEFIGSCFILFLLFFHI